MKYHPRSQWGEGILGEEVRWAKARRLGGTCTPGGPRHGLCDCSMQSGSRGVVDDIMNILVNGPQRFKMSIESKYQMLWSWLETQPNKDNQWKQLLVIKSYK